MCGCRVEGRRLWIQPLDIRGLWCCIKVINPFDRVWVLTNQKEPDVRG